MRIIAGTAKGVPLRAPSRSARPTAALVREALFSILAPVLPGARILDLCAGSGALALEALSRGAASATLIDPARDAAAAIRHNISRTRLPATFLQRDAATFLRSNRQTHDLVFLDPPYRSPLLREILGHPSLPRALAPGGHLVVETPADEPPPIPEDLRQTDARPYGKTLLTFLQHQTPA